MAGNAAHITSSLLSKPSLFEVMAQDSLCELLYPSFKIIVQFLSTNYPERYQALSAWSEEAFLAINGVLQLYYLNNKGASFSESFYGLQRVSFVGKHNQLSSGDKYWSLFCLVGLPYLVRKGEKYVDKLQNLKVGELANLTHRVLTAGWQALCLIQYVLYLTNRSQAHSPLLSVANLSLHYSQEQAQSSYTWAEIFTSPKVCARAVRNGMTSVLELSAFFLQALQWWHSSDKGHDKLANFIPPPPPQVTERPPSLAVCPVCKERCKIETVLMTSGYVFCFRCIREALLSTQKCPVTGLPATLDELVRLYPTK